MLLENLIQPNKGSISSPKMGPQCRPTQTSRNNSLIENPPSASVIKPSQSKRDYKKTGNQRIRDMALWCTIGSKLKEGPIRSSEIKLPTPWPATRRIPGQTLPPAGRFRFIKITQCGPLNMGTIPSVLPIRKYLKLHPELNVFNMQTDDPVPNPVKNYVNFKANENVIEEVTVKEPEPIINTSTGNTGSKKKGKKGKKGKGKKGKGAKKGKKK